MYKVRPERGERKEREKRREKRREREKGEKGGRGAECSMRRVHESLMLPVFYPLPFSLFFTVHVLLHHYQEVQPNLNKRDF